LRLPLAEFLFPPDPGTLRLLGALRATLAGTLTFFVMVLLGNVAPLPVTDRILGFGIALYIAASVRDATPRERLITIALAPFFAFAATAAATLLSDRPVGAATLLPVIMFAVAYAVQRGARRASLGTVALIAYFIGLVAHEPAATLPLRALVLLLAAGSAALIRCMLLPDRPQTELNRLRRAIHGEVLRLLDRIAAAVAAGRWTKRERWGVRREIARLDDMVMLAQARVGMPAFGHDSEWLHLLTLEIGIERVVRVAANDLGTSAERGPLLAMLAALRQGAPLPAPPSHSRLAGALALLGRVVREAAHAGNAPIASAPTAASTPDLRPAAQTAIATALAIVVGDLVSPARWYWAAFTAFAMFQGTRSRGDSLLRGVQSLLGTLAGVIAGMLLATLLSGHELLTVAAIVVAVFFAFQANVAAYGAMVFWITVILGLMFGMLGFFPPDLLLLRLKETAAGAACGAAVASLVLARGERAAIEEALAAVLRALGQSVDGAVRGLLDDHPPADLASRILAAEQRGREMMAIAQSWGAGLAPGRNAPLHRRVLVLEGCELWARELGQMALQGARVQDPPMVLLAREAAESIGAAIERLAKGELPISVTSPSPSEDLPIAVRLLLRIQFALVHMSSP
jgi:uncharacterized membrane protein YccC